MPRVRDTVADYSAAVLLVGYTAAANCSCSIVAIAISVLRSLRRSCAFLIPTSRMIDAILDSTLAVATGAGSNLTAGEVSGLAPASIRNRSPWLCFSAACT